MKVTVKEAIECLNDGHTIWKPDYAEAICKAIGVEFDKRIIHKFYSDPVGTPKGLTMNQGQEGTEGVHALELSAYVYVTLKCEGVRDCFGMGSQARAYTEKIQEKLNK